MRHRYYLMQKMWIWLRLFEQWKDDFAFLLKDLLLELMMRILGENILRQCVVFQILVNSSCQIQNHSSVLSRCYRVAICSKYCREISSERLHIHQRGGRSRTPCLKQTDQWGSFIDQDYAKHRNSDKKLVIEKLSQTFLTKSTCWTQKKEW